MIVSQCVSRDRSRLKVIGLVAIRGGKVALNLLHVVSSFRISNQIVERGFL